MQRRIETLWKGNARAKEIVARFLLSGRFPHALLLEGERGTGKTAFARLLAQALLCKGEDRPCGVCLSCRKACSGNHPDIICFERAEGTASFSVKRARELREDLSISPVESDYKIYIIPHADLMTVQAQNALLKSLEEPPAHVRFILTAENRKALLGTILSRVVPVRLFSPPVQEAIEAVAAACPDRTLEEIQPAAERMEGNIGRTLELLRDAAAGKKEEQMDGILHCLCVRSGYPLLVELSKLERDRTGACELFCRMYEQIAHVIRLKGEEEKPPLYFDEMMRSFSLEGLMQLSFLCREAAKKIENNTNIALTVAWFCAAACEIQ